MANFRVRFLPIIFIRHALGGAIGCPAGPTWHKARQSSRGRPSASRNPAPALSRLLILRIVHDQQAEVHPQLQIKRLLPRRHRSRIQQPAPTEAGSSRLQPQTMRNRSWLSRDHASRALTQGFIDLPIPPRRPQSSAACLFAGSPSETASVWPAQRLSRARSYILPSRDSDRTLADRLNRRPSDGPRPSVCQTKSPPHFFNKIRAFSGRQGGHSLQRRCAITVHRVSGSLQSFLIRFETLQGSRSSYSSS